MDFVLLLFGFIIFSVKKKVMTAKKPEKKEVTEVAEAEDELHIEESTVSGGLRSIRDIVRDLSKPIAGRHLRKRRQGGKEISYITWHDAIKYLDHYAPGWCYEVRRIENFGGKLILTVRLSIPSIEGWTYREATGQEDDDLDNYGDPSSNAESMALRRAASKFGLALYLYDQ